MKIHELDRFAALQGWFENTCFKIMRKEPGGRWILTISFLGAGKERMTEYLLNQRGHVREFATLDSVLSVLLKYRACVDVSVHDQTKAELDTEETDSRLMVLTFG